MPLFPLQFLSHTQPWPTQKDLLITEDSSQNIGFHGFLSCHSNSTQANMGSLVRHGTVEHLPPHMTQRLKLEMGLEYCYSLGPDIPEPLPSVV